MKDKLILSFYVDTRDKEEHEIVPYLNQVKEAMHNQMESSGGEGAMALFIPIKGESRVECINPVLVTEEEAIANFNKAIGELQELSLKLQEKTIEKDEKA
jgi:hypothetical protein